MDTYSRYVCAASSSVCIHEGEGDVCRCVFVCVCGHLTVEAHMCTCLNVCVYECVLDSSTYRSMAYRYFPDSNGATIKWYEDDGRLTHVPILQWNALTQLTSRDDDVLLCSYSRSGNCFL